MTATAGSLAATADEADVGRLRTLLRLDAAACAATGVVAAAASDPVADRLGVDRPGVVLAVGVFLIVYGADLWLLSRARRRTAVVGASVSVAGDALWVAATLGLAVAGAFSAGGLATMAAVGLLVGALGISKATTLRHDR